MPKNHGRKSTHSMKKVTRSIRGKVIGGKREDGTKRWEIKVNSFSGEFEENKETNVF